jgi:hypothetical protein
LPPSTADEATAWPVGQLDPELDPAGNQSQLTWPDPEATQLGDQEMRRRDRNPFVDSTAADIRPEELSDDQIQGESGLIPRQETLSFVRQSPAQLRQRLDGDAYAVTEVMVFDDPRA